MFQQVILIILGVVCAVFFGWLFIYRLRKNKIYFKRNQIDIIMNTIEDFVYIKDIKSRFVVANKKNAETFGLSSQKKLVGKSDMDFYPEKLANKFLKDEQRIITTGEPIIGNIEKGIDKEGKEIDISTTKYPIFNRKKEVVGIVGIGREVTGLMEYERKLEDLNKKLEEANSEKDKLLSIVAHDLKNPFNTLRGYAELLDLSYEKLSEKKKHEYVQQIAGSSKALTHLVDNLLEWSVSQKDGIKTEAERIDVVKSIKEHILQHRLEADTKGLDVSIDVLVNTGVFVSVDVGMFDTIIRNLLSNAIKFTPENGRVDFEVDVVDEKVEIKILDTGVGVEQKQIDAFMRGQRPEISYGTNGEKGTGLGLSVCQEFAKRNRGAIIVEKNEPKGTAFTLILPKSV